MIQKEALKNIINEVLSKSDLVLVDLIISKTNKIEIFIDSPKGVTIGECAKLSRTIESKLDREQEDFQLEVSSPGLDRPLKMPFQYKKNIGRQLEVIINDGNKFTGTIIQADDKCFVLEHEIKEKTEGANKKQLVIRKNILAFNDIKTAKVIVKF